MRDLAKNGSLCRPGVHLSNPGHRAPRCYAPRPFPGGRMRALAVCLLLIASPGRGGASADTHTPPAAYEDMAVDLLRQYLQIDTTVPPGNELRGARFYQRILAQE